MLEFYRYVSNPDEIKQMLEQRRIQSTNPKGRITWYTTVRYDDPVVAQRELALSRAPTHRIGPIPADVMPSFDAGPRDVAPLGGKSGGGLEARTPSPVFVFGLWNFDTKDWLL